MSGGLISSTRGATRRVLVALLLLASASCQDAPKQAPAHRAFYAWRTSFGPSSAERDALERLHVDRIYLRYFDVDAAPADGTAKPRAKVSFAPDLALPARVEIVPVVFLRERVFHGLSAEGTARLAERVWSEVQRLSRQGNVVLRELQLDCDWTDTTRAPFFAFLEQLGLLAGPAEVTLSATIRLHQVKYRERTGVPPVSRGMLMFYNMGRIAPGERAIFDAAKAEAYLARLPEYPLALDVALPIWSWTVHLRDDRVEGLLQNTDPATLSANDALEPAPAGRFLVKRPTFVQGTLLREGDVLQPEVIEPSIALEAARLVAPRLAPASPARTISLFDLSERNLARHDVEALDRLFRTIR